MTATEISLRVRDYDLAATLDSGQVFRWQSVENSWHGVVGGHSVRLTQLANGIHAETAAPVADWNFLRQFLQTEIDFSAVLKTFPDDEPMRHAVARCHGLRLLRQDPWECLASFILSSTKQIVQIRQIVALLCERFGEPVSLSSPKGGEGTGEEADYFETQIPSPPPSPGFGATSQPSPRLGGAREENGLCFAFPSAKRLAASTEAELRACKMGFRAPHLLAAARQIADGWFDLERLRHLPMAGAREELMKLRGVGGKIADCVLLFAYGFDGAFPVDVWVERALRELYFPRRRVGDKRLRHFAARPEERSVRK